MLTLLRLDLQKYSSVRQLARALQAFMKEHELDPQILPCASMLRAADRTDLLNGINHHGGLFVLGPKLGMTTTRGPGWPDITAAAQALHAAAQQLGSTDSITVNGSSSSNTVNGRSDGNAVIGRSMRQGSGQDLQMPTMQQLRDVGRRDLVYAVQKFGYQEIADAAGLAGSRGRGRPISMLSQCL